MFFRKIVVLVFTVAVFAAAAFWLPTIPSVVLPSEIGDHVANLANGETMFHAGGCSSCHAVPKQEDATKLGGGLGLVSPFGTFYVPNISSDPNDGIGGWSEAQFVTAMTKGTSPERQHLFPAFPYTSYAHMRIDDVRDLFAYLKTLQPVSGKVRDHDLAFPFNIRRFVGFWKLLFFDGGTFKPDPAQTAEWNRGAYLVNGPAHCAECHSPRNFLGAIIPDKRFAGGPSPSGQGGVPNITQFKLKDWSLADIEDTLDTGMTPDADRVGGEMVEVVRNTSKLSKADRAAMALYIKSLAPVEGVAPKKAAN
jgi:mono/diheme cytochrome c family protein